MTSEIADINIDKYISISIETDIHKIPIERSDLMSNIIRILRSYNLVSGVSTISPINEYNNYASYLTKYSYDRLKEKMDYINKSLQRGHPIDTYVKNQLASLLIELNLADISIDNYLYTVTREHNP